MPAILAVMMAVLPVAASVEDDLPADLAHLHATGHYKELATELRDAVEDEPKSAPLYYWLGRSYYELRDYDRAEDNLDRAVELAPNRSEYHDWLGKASGRKAQQANPFSALTLARKAYHAFQTAVKLAPTNIEAQRDLIRYLFNAPSFLGGGDDAALKQIQELSVVNAVDGMLARAEYFASKKKYEEAAAEYQKIQKAGVPRVGVQFEIAEFYRDRGDAGGMRTAVDAARELSPSDSRLPYYDGVALVLAGRDPARAESQLRTYTQKVPDGSEVPPHASAHQWLGTLYERQGQRDRAIAEYQTSLSLDPRNAESRKGLERLRTR